MGATQPGDVAYVAGSSTVILGVSQSRPVDAQQRFIVTPMAHSGSWGLEMDLMSTGGAIRWAAQLFGFSSVEQAMTAARVADSLKVPSVLPYVSPGEQGALWDANLTGVVAGLNLSHTAGDVMRGIIDGIVVESRRCVEVLREYGCQASTILVAGGSALDPWFRQLLADACGALVVAPTDGDSDYSAIGAALLLGGPVASGQRSTVHPVGDENYWEQRLADADALRHAVRTVPKPLTDTKGSGSLRSW
jgi:xylulokinase